jgi:signal peptidase I
MATTAKVVCPVKAAALTLLIASAVASVGCERGRRAYLAASRKVIRNVTTAMLPTVKEGQYLVIDREYYSARPVRRFDMIIVKDPQGTKAADGSDTFLFNRVVGLGGEKVEVRGGTLYLDGKPLREPFAIVPHDRSEEFGPYVIPQGEYFLLGDNRPNSFDSRYWDKPSVDKSFIYAKVTEIFSE